MIQQIARGSSGVPSGVARRVGIAALMLSAAIAIGGTPRAFAAGMAEEDVPATSIVPDSTESAPAPPSLPPSSKPKSSTKSSSKSATTSGTTAMPEEEAAPEAAPPTTKHTTSHAARTHTGTTTSTHHGSSHASSAAHHVEVEVEPTTARLKLIKDAPAYSSASSKSKHLEQLHADKFVNVTGSTKSFLRVKLKNGETAYIEPGAVQLIKPIDKIFQLTHDAAVLEKPNRWAKKVAEVHQPHNVHVIGLALEYMMIRMKDGLVGFIPITALQ